MPKKRIQQDRGVVRVTFELPAEVEGRTVHLVGDFTSWKGIPMEKKDDGWRATVDLEPGRSYEFRYLIDGERWENDWAADRYVSNPFGHENSVIETPPLPATAAIGETEKNAPKRSAPKKAAARKAAKKTATKKKSAATKTAATKASKPAKKTASKSAKKASKKDGQPKSDSK